MKINNLDLSLTGLFRALPTNYTKNFFEVSPYVGAVAITALLKRPALTSHLLKGISLRLNAQDFSSLFRGSVIKPLNLQTPTGFLKLQTSIDGSFYFESVKLEEESEMPEKSMTLLSVFKNDVLGGQELAMEKEGGEFEVRLLKEGVDKKGISSKAVANLLKMVNLEQYAFMIENGSINVTASCPKTISFTTCCTEEGASLEFTDPSKMIRYEAKIGAGILSMSKQFVIQGLCLSSDGDVSVKVAQVNKDGSLAEGFMTSFGRVEGNSSSRIGALCSEIWS